MQPGFAHWAFGGHKTPDRMFFVSRSNMEDCRSAVKGVVPESIWRVVPNGLDLEVYQPDDVLRRGFRERLGLDSSIVIGVACALRANKQLEHFFDAAARLTHHEVRFLVAGGTYPGEESYAERLIHDAGQILGHRLAHLGKLNGLREFCCGIDLFVNTSKNEAFGISVLESLSCGTPVVGYPSGAVRDLVLPGGGEIVAQNSVDELSDALSRWVANPELRAAGRTGSRRRAEESFDIHRISQIVWDEYDAVLSESRRHANYLSLLDWFPNPRKREQSA